MTRAELIDLLQVSGDEEDEVFVLRKGQPSTDTEVIVDVGVDDAGDCVIWTEPWTEPK